jgi:type I restriction enzyme S subunit
MSDKADVGGNAHKLRFPEFRDGPEWDERLLGDVFDFHSTANNSRADLSSTGDTFYIHYGDIHTKFHFYIDFSKDEVPRIQSGKYGKATFLKNGDLVVADASEDTDGIAKAVEVRGLEKGIKAISGLHTLLLRDPGNIYVDGFKGLLREIEKVKTQIRKLAVGVKVYAVSKTILKQVLLPLPPQTEQQKIADCLSSIDELIAAQSKKLTALRAHKKGLMQQLFPSADEAHG